MSFFTSGAFWFLEGVLAVGALVGLKVWMEDRRTPMPLWKWPIAAAWLVMAGATIAFIATSIGENEIVAAVKGGIIFSVLCIIVAAAAWRLLQIGRVKDTPEAEASAAAEDPLPGRPPMWVFQRIAGVVALGAIVAAWVIGAPKQGPDVEPFLHQALPAAIQFAPTENGIHEGRNPKKADNPVVGYVTVAQANGYGGPMHVAVGVDTSGKITGAAIVDHKETPAFFDRIKAERSLGALVGKSHTDAFVPGDDIDTVTGATMSFDALAATVRQGSRRLAGEALGLPVKAPSKEPLRLALPEALLALLFVLGLVTYAKLLRRRPKMRNALRWTTRLAGLVLLGFLLTAPLSIITIHSLLAGSTPDWRANIYWYLLIVIAFGPLALAGRGVYCDTLCPFGAAQDILAIGGAKRALPRLLRRPLRWMQRTLALLVIIVALVYRNPGRLDYEVFGTFFTLRGTVFQLAFLGGVLVASLFLLRPWCNVLCPLRAIGDYVRMLRNWARDILPKRQVASDAPPDDLTR